MTLGYGNRYQRTSEHISAIFESLLKLRTLVVISPFCAGATPLKQHNNQMRLCVQQFPKVGTFRIRVFALHEDIFPFYS